MVNGGGSNDGGGMVTVTIMVVVMFMVVLMLVVMVVVMVPSGDIDADDISSSFFHNVVGWLGFSPLKLPFSLLYLVQNL